MKNTEKTMDKIVALCKNRGFVFPGSEIYGGLANTWDYGPLGAELKKNIKNAWWKKFVQENPYNVGLDAAILMNPQTWVASGHLSGFSDPLMDCRECHERFRADKLIEDWCAETGFELPKPVDAFSQAEMKDFIEEHNIPCPTCGKHNFTDIRQFNLMFKTFQGVTEDAKNTVYLRPETAQGIFVNFNNVQRTTRKKLPFGISCCYTSKNVEMIGSEEYFDQMIAWGARFCWFFTYMPVGKDAVPELMVSAEQRKFMYEQVHKFRETKPLFTLDFWNDGEYVNGCIAGGRVYLHINANGDVDPCVFIHYSNVNIKDHTLLEVLKSPLFMAYHREQPFNRDHLRPCPMLENPQMLRKMVEESGAHSTDMESPESVDHLCAKCDDYAAAWAPVAKEIWAEQKHKKPSYTNYDPAQERGVFQEKIDT